MINTDPYITEYYRLIVVFASDFMAQNPITMAILGALIAMLAKRNATVKRWWEKFKAWKK